MVRFLAVTVSVFALLVADPQPFVKTARYWLPLAETGGFVRVSVPLVSPDRLVKLPPPFVLTCHWTAGEVPLAAAVKLAFDP
jgi:hypothetical protein